MTRTGSSRARQQIIYRRRRQTLLIITCLSMALVGSLAGMLGRGIAFALPMVMGTAQALHHDSNILLVGVDDNYDPKGKRIRSDRARTDTVMVVTLRPGERSVHVLSIPRDTQVLIPGYGTEKINAAHAFGGIERTREVVESLIGIRLDHSFEVSLSGAASVLDELGGVDVFVEQPMHYEDHTAKLKIDFEPGWHHLGGKEAVGFARFRHDALGDIGRVTRQQTVMHAVEQKLLSPVNWWRLPQLAKSAGELFKTDLGTPEILELAHFAKDHPSVSYTTLPGEFGHNGYWIPSHVRIVALMESLTNDRPRRKHHEKPVVEVLYGDKQEQAASKLANQLTEKGLTVVRLAPVASGQVEVSRVIGRNGNASLNDTVASLTAQYPWQLSDDPSPYSADYTVVVGPDHR